MKCNIKTIIDKIDYLSDDVIEITFKILNKKFNFNILGEIPLPQQA